MRKTNLVDLMQRYISGQVTEQEKQKIEAWLDVKKTMKGANELLEPEDEERLFRTITSNDMHVNAVKTFQPKPHGQTLRSYRSFRVAAAVSFIALTSVAAWILSGQYTGPAKSGASIEKTILTDGSIVWLHRHSQLTYDNRTNGRHATFSGEGLFEVAKDPARPFTITCGSVTVQVIGTSFSLKSKADTFQLKVLTGKVKVSSPSDVDGTIIHANQMAAFDASGKLITSTLQKNDIAMSIGPAEYNMKFRNTRMETVIFRIEQKFDVSISVKDSELMSCRITADFTDNSLRATLDMLTELLEIDYQIADQAVSISGKGCH